jgi:glycosyltransferase involved in cell wall biosynthesis
LTSLAFIVPCWKRHELTRICLSNLASTCASLDTLEIEAVGIVIANGRNLDTAKSLGFWTVNRANDGLGAKYNDGIQFAAAEGLDYVIPFGSDNLIDPKVVAASIPDGDQIATFAKTYVLNETGTRGSKQLVDYLGGVGIRIYPTAIFAPCDFRPAESERMFAVDSSITNTLARMYGKPPYVRADKHEYQIVGVKTNGKEQLNPYAAVSKRFGVAEQRNPLRVLREHYPAETLDALERFYAGEQ